MYSVYDIERSEVYCGVSVLSMKCDNVLYTYIV
jgi:hypothetical protein